LKRILTKAFNSSGFLKKLESPTLIFKTDMIPEKETILLLIQRKTQTHKTPMIQILQTSHKKCRRKKKLKRKKKDLRKGLKSVK